MLRTRTGPFDPRSPGDARLPVLGATGSELSLVDQLHRRTVRNEEPLVHLERVLAEVSSAGGDFPIHSNCAIALCLICGAALPPGTSTPVLQRRASTLGCSLWRRPYLTSARWCPTRGGPVELKQRAGIPKEVSDQFSGGHS